MPQRLWLARTTAVAPFILFVVVYLPAAGHGFIKDDYSWILNNRVRDWPGLLHLFHSDNGFYRPMVAATFALNERVFDAVPRGYGITNVVLALLCGASISSLARGLHLSRGAALAAGALWLLNFHGIAMSILWISGRTALVLTLAATASAAALVRGHLVVAVLWLAVALFAKEEAVVLPFVLLAWLFLLRRAGKAAPASIVGWTAAAAVIEAGYFLARASTRAMTPSTAPAFYRLTFSVGAVLHNAGQYADRVATFPAAVVLLAILVLGSMRSVFDDRTRTILYCGVVWVVGGLSLTIFLPVRSDLYACFPSVGVCLGAAAVLARLWDLSSFQRQQRALVAALVLLVFLSPVYHLRTRRWVSFANFASSALADLQRLTSAVPDGAHVVIEDDRAQRANMASVFGTLLNDAYRLHTGRQMNLWIEPALDDAPLAGLRPPCSTCVALALKVSDGHLEKKR